MDELLDQLMKALNAKLYFLAVVGAMTVPDIGGAVDDPNGYATRTTYVAWTDRYFIHKYSPHFASADLYQLRCSLVHQGKLAPNAAKTPILRLLLTEPDPIRGTTHKMTIGKPPPSTDKVVLLNANTFVRDMVASARLWIATVGATPLFQQNTQDTVTRRPNGFPPYVIGHPVIC